MQNFELTAPLIDVSENTAEAGKGKPRSYWTIGNAVEGVQIFGGIGSGKTSGSGRMLALTFLRAGFGGLVLTAKPDEKDLWKYYLSIAKRDPDDLIVIEPGRTNYFNFIDYESSHASDGNSLTENLVQVLKTVLNASEEKGGKGGQDPFWETSLDMLLYNVIDLCKFAYGTVSLEKMYDIVQTLPREKLPDFEKLKHRKDLTAFQDAFLAAMNFAALSMTAWEKNYTEAQLMEMDNDGTLQARFQQEDLNGRLYYQLKSFFLDTYFRLPEKTRFTIDFSFSGFLFRLLREPVYSLFCRHASKIRPEASLEGKIILVNLPVKLYHKIGRDCQIMFKYIWQRAMERRNPKDDGGRPVFLWADEAQNFLHEHDADYQATARSSKIATVYISQNLPNYYANMGGEKSEFRVKSFLGTLATKFFHANADIETNRYASDLIGEAFMPDAPSETSSVSGNNDVSSSQTKSYKLQRIVRPEAFLRLKTGGEANDAKVTGYMCVQGGVFGNGFNHKIMAFDQEYLDEEAKQKRNTNKPKL